MTDKNHPLYNKLTVCDVNILIDILKTESASKKKFETVVFDNRMIKYKTPKLFSYLLKFFRDLGRFTCIPHLVPGGKQNQREVYSEKLWEATFIPFEDLPIHMSDDEATELIVNWRLQIGK